MKIQFYAKTSYGNVNRYIVDSVAKEAVKSLTGKLTVSYSDLEALHALGHEIEQVNDPAVTLIAMPQFQPSKIV